MVGKHKNHKDEKKTTNQDTCRQNVKIMENEILFFPNLVFCVWCSLYVMIKT